MGRPWGRLYCGMRNHRKIVALSRRHPTHWRIVYTLLEMSFETWDNGKILAAPGIPYTLSDLAEELRISPKKLLPILRTMDELSLVKFLTKPDSKNDDFDFKNAKKTKIFLHFSKWNERQFESDTSAERTRKWRAKQDKSGSYDNSLTSPSRAGKRHSDGVSDGPDTDTDTETETRTPIVPLKKGTVFSVQELAGLWNRKAPPELSRVHLPLKRPPREMNKIRDAMKRNPDINWWEKVIVAVHNAPFLRGENDRGWKASIDFVVRKAEEILDGKYESMKKEPQGFAAIRASTERRQWDVE